MKNEQFVRHFISVESLCDKDVMRQVMNFMDDESADAILAENGGEWSENYSYLAWKRGARKSLDKSFHKNETVDELLALYLNPKSKKVVYARDCLWRRFSFLSFEEQCKIIDTFMKRGYVHDLVNCCKRMVDDEYWRDEYREIVEQFYLRTLEVNTRNSYPVAKIVARHSSQEFIKACIEMLDDEEMCDLEDVLQVLLIGCEEHPDMVLKNVKLTPDRYAYVMVKKGQRISEEEARMALESTLSDQHVSKEDIKIMCWVVAQMGYLDLLLDFGTEVERFMVKRKNFTPSDIF